MWGVAPLCAPQMCINKSYNFSTAPRNYKTFSAAYKS